MEAGRNLVGGSRANGSAAGVTTAMIFAAVTIIAGIAGAIVPRPLWAAQDTANPVVATIGKHHITQQEMDAAVLQNMSRSQLYEARKDALDTLIDGYIIEQAAKKAHLTTAAYLARELDSKTGQVTVDEAHKYYDAHKAGIDSQTGGRPFSDIQGLIVNALQRHRDRDRREALITKLRGDDNVKVALEEPRVNVASEGHPWTGGKDARVTIVEFSDFQCPYCRAAEPALKNVRAKYGDKVKLVYMDFPLGMHQHAMDAAVAGRCASDQDKFWQFHDAMFADQTKLDPASLKANAAKIGLDTKKFNDCFDAKAAVPGIKADQAQGEQLGVSGTPTFFVNGREMVGAETEQGFSDVIDDELAHPKASQTQANAH
jgi:predicted DsbA family dithiol-disulfide isomerase